MGAVGTFWGLVQLARPQQVIKNLFVFAPLIFSHSLWNPEKVYASVVAFVLFSIAASSVYMFNDIVDVRHDAQNPLRQHRPLVQGALSVRVAAFVASAFAFVAIALSYVFSANLLAVLIVYFALNMFYSLWIKYQPILDLFCVALGFVLRILAGTVVIGVTATPWMLGVTFFLALYVVAAKRLREYSLVANSGERRPVLRFYSRAFLENIVFASLILTIAIYLLYAFLQVHDALFLITCLPVLYGLFRFLWLVEQSALATDNPTDFIYRDVPLALSIIVFCIGVAMFFLFADGASVARSYS